MIINRFATPSDICAVTELLHKIDKDFPIPLSEKVVLNELARKFLEKGYVYLASDDGKSVGMLGFYANDFAEKTAYFSVLGVVSTHKRRGIARSLLCDALEYSKERGMERCVLYTHKTNTGAIAMYEKLGFSPEVDEGRPNDIRFVKKL